MVLLSGGLDSMVTAALAAESGHEVHALTIDYGQRHVRELQSAKAIAGKLGVARHVELPLDLRKFGGSALTDDIAVQKSGVGEDIPATYVPGSLGRELTLTIGWGAVSRVDLLPGQCADPECEGGDHGYEGTITADDIALRISAEAEGRGALERAIEFARDLSSSIGR